MRRTILAPGLLLQQRTIAAQQLEVALSNLESLIVAIEEDPELAESALLRARREGLRGQIAYGRAIGYLLQGPANGEPMPLPAGGITFVGDLFELATDGLGRPEFQIVLDGSGKLLVKRIVCPAGRGRQLTKISDSRVRQFLNYLRKQSVWMHETVSTALTRIADYQKDFVTSLIVLGLRALPISQLSSRLALPYHSSTYYRLLRRRTVEIERGSSPTVIPVQLLLRNDNDLKRYEVIRRLNDFLLLEVRDQRAFSDSQFAALLERLIPSGASRRVVARYREEAQVPSALMRQREYANGRREPFIIHCDWEIWLRVAPTGSPSALIQESDASSPNRE